MFKKLFSRRGGVAVATAALGISGMTLSFAGVAGATPNASELTGSGSQTSYSTMVGLSDLFNGSPGCDLTAAGDVTLNCSGNPFAPGTVNGEQGFTVAAENPYNDFTAQAPAVGSGNGVAEIQNSANYPAAYARSSKGTGGNTAQNFIQYATDAVSWTGFKTVAGVSTNQHSIKDISTANLKAIYNYTLSCTDGAGFTVTDDWFCLPGYTGTTTDTVTAGVHHVDPIDCYISQTGSGTYSTWAGYMGFATGTPPPPPACANHEKSGTLASHTNLPENQMHVISTMPDAKYALYFMSLGKFTTTCPLAVCEGTPSNDLTTFGKIDGIKAKQSTVQGSGGGVGVTFHPTRGLYNVYNNSSSVAPQVAANQAALNLVSEYGFLCKKSTTTDIDPQTNVSYRTEIENTILGQGFFPIDVGQTAFAQGTLTDRAVFTDAGYTAIDNTSATTGFCLATNG